MLEPLSRRTVLRGAGAVVALPLLQAMVPPRRTTLEGPRRLVFVYVPNGVDMPSWTPAGATESGLERDLADLELSPTLAPLAPYRESLLVLGGLAHDKARANGDGAGDHARAAATFLTGRQALKTDGPIRAGVSADQVAAREIGNLTRIRSLELGCEAGRLGGQCDNGYSCAYSNSISWSTPHTPLGKEVDPRLVFDRLFREPDSHLPEPVREKRRLRRRSVLDLVGEEAKRLSGRLGPEDRRKLDEYASGVRELERRIEFAAQERDDAASERFRESPPDVAGLAMLQAELIALSLATDTTRIVTWMLANEGSGASYPTLGVPEGHHELSHHGGDRAKREKIAAINRFHVGQLAYLLEKLSASEGEATLLERSAVAYGSAIGDGDRHNHDDLPILVAGRAGGAITSGRYLRFASETPCANLWLTLLDAVGVEAPALGDSTGRLALG
jgi:hypothetical protein